MNAPMPTSLFGAVKMGLDSVIVYGLLRAGVPNRSEVPDAATTDCQ